MQEGVERKSPDTVQIRLTAIITDIGAQWTSHSRLKYVSKDPEDQNLIEFKPSAIELQLNNHLIIKGLRTITCQRTIA